MAGFSFSTLGCRTPEYLHRAEPACTGDLQPSHDQAGRFASEIPFRHSCRPLMPSIFPLPCACSIMKRFRDPKPVRNLSRSHLENIR